jgi:hypothetical protein
MNTDHPPIERLSELADGDSASDSAPMDARDVARHVADCAACRATIDRLRALLEQAAALPASIDPPPLAWHGIRERVTRRRTASPGREIRWVREWGLRAAAAVLLVAGSSALTVLALRSRTSEPVVADAARDAVATRVVPTAVSAVERSYADAVDELTRTLHDQRAALAPATIATLERTLRVIDEAIAEARAALAADPSNRALLDVLSANYEQKVQLLRRASELPART